MLWAQVLNARTDVTRLGRARPELAGRLDAIRAELDRPSGGGLGEREPYAGQVLRDRP